MELRQITSLLLVCAMLMFCVSAYADEGQSESMEAIDPPFETTHPESQTE